MKRLIILLLVLFLTGLLAAASAEDAAQLQTPGSIICFGHYEQDNIRENGPEAIEWVVLDTPDGKSLLISRYELDVRPYNETYGPITWEECTLRKWLNGEFLSAAFSEEEQQAIVLNHTDNSAAQSCSKYRTNPGNDTTDRVFLLSYAEADRYFDSNEARKCSPTPYAIANGAHTVMHAGRLCGLWWLRSPGDQQYRVSIAYSGGALNYTYASKKIGTVRPVILLDPERMPEN